MKPLVSVLMPVYNCEKFLAKAIESILLQSWQKFEFIIVNDGSTDNSCAIIKSYDDTRIKLLQNTTNIGLVKSLNRGLQFAQGEYIARMDADDISLPERLEKQVEFMEYNKNVGLCGTFARTIGSGISNIRRVPETDADIRASLFFINVFVHPSVMIRRKIIAPNCLSYDESSIHAEDYDFWVCLSKHTNLANLAEVLVLYRIHNNSISMNKKNIVVKEESIKSIILKQLDESGFSASREELEIHKQICSLNFTPQFTPQRDFVESAHNWLLKLKKMNIEQNIFGESSFLRALAERWYRVCRHSQKLGPWTWKNFRRSPLHSYVDLSVKNKISFAVKCFLRIS